VSHERKLDADRAALAANQNERKQSETAIQAAEEKISKFKTQMADAKTNEQYRAFQTEIEFCQTGIRKLEDRILDLMTESEPLDRNVKAAEVALRTEKVQVEAEKNHARERTAEDQKAAAELQQERAAIIAQMAANTVQRYERARKARRGIAVAEVVEGRCNQCHMALRLQYFQDLKKETEILSCESCQRLLYYNPPVAVEDLTNDPAAVQQ
jgi:predicted  nucleic acid-binding Zn-ribbon protein